MSRDAGQGPIGDSVCPLAATTRQQLVAFGKLLRDKRNQAGLSRMELARKAKISDATVKFVETAKHPPSRQTLLRLVNVPELGLKWSETPGATTQSAPSGSAEITTAAALYRVDSRVAVSLVLDAFLLLDEIQVSLAYVEITPHGARKACALCGMRSPSWAKHADEAAKLPIPHAAPCVAPLLASVCQRNPVITELAKEERLAQRSEISIQIEAERSAARIERFLGCRSIGEVAAHLARAAEEPRDEFRKGASDLLLWALAMGPCPVEPGGDGFTETRASQIAYKVKPAADGTRLSGIVQAAQWLVAPTARAPCGREDSPAGKLPRRVGHADP